MSYLPPTNAGYFEAVQVFFTEVTARAVLFGPHDQALLQRWREEGRPAKVVCRGIREAVVSYGEEARPRTLRQCASFVDAAWEKARQNQVGGHETQESVSAGPVAIASASAPAADLAPEAPPAESAAPPQAGGGLFQEVSQALKQAGSGTEEERWRQAYRVAWREMVRLERERSDFSLEEVELLDAVLVEAYLAALSPAEQASINETLEEISGGLLGGMSPTARREHLRARRKRALVERYGLLDLLEVLRR